MNESFKTLNPPLVLSLFPGIGLLDRAFELEGFSVVRGPDLLWGGDVRRFHVPADRFDGVIGGPPCQVFSTASVISGTKAIDLIPDFVRVVNEANPKFIVMENVRQAARSKSIPKAWLKSVLRDWDCGGLTHRTRAIWTFPHMIMEPGGKEKGDAVNSVMASTWKRGSSSFNDAKGYLRGDLPVEEYARLQGAEEIGAALIKHKAGRQFAVHCLGNGVPLAIGRHVAKQTAAALGFKPQTRKETKQ
jgi:DNA (cytosine-5)-methyltransferase 1